jgi:manganese/zinc/iron transport system permease protein
LAAGAVIVLVGSAFFLASMLFGPCRGIVRRAVVQWRLRRRAGRQHLLRAMYECVEMAVADKAARSPSEMTSLGVSFDTLLAKRTWTARRLRRLISHARRHNLLTIDEDGKYSLTAAGLVEARRVARNHRLWELYLISHADVAPSRVDRFADLIEHVLEPDILVELENLLAEQYPHMVRMPASPHELERPEPVPG